MLFIPDFEHNLLYVARLMQQNKLKVIFSDDKCLFQDLSNGTFLIEWRRFDGIYTLELKAKECKKNQQETEVFSLMNYNNFNVNKKREHNVMLKHHRLGHTSLNKLKRVSQCKLQWFG